MIHSRIEEFREFVDINKQNKDIKQEKRFYEILNDKIAKLYIIIKNSSSYKNCLVFEDKLRTLSDEVRSLDNIDIDEEYKEMYEGIKYILKYKIIKTKQLLNKKKMGGLDIQIDESKVYVDKREGKIDDFTQHELMEMQRENKQIVYGKQYEDTRQRLRQIDKVQQAIGEQLDIQNERIDDICEISKETRTTYKNINKIVFTGANSWFKNTLHKFIIFVIILLLLLHYRNR